MTGGKMDDHAFAAYIDDLYARTNRTSLPIGAQHWTPEMLIEMYVSSTIDIGPIVLGRPDEAWSGDIEGILLDVLVYTEGNAPPPLTSEQQSRLNSAITEAKASYWRGKLVNREN